MLNTDSPMPLYHQLAGLLGEQIREGGLVAGDRLPSEHALSARYGLSRPTVRQATELLQRRGLVERRRGAGTFVRKRPQQVDLLGLGGTLRAFRDSGLPVETELRAPLRRCQLPADAADHPLAGEEVLFLQRLSRLQGQPVLLESLWFHATLFAELLERDLRGVSLSVVVEEELYLRPLRAEQRFRAVVPGCDDAALLELPRGAPALQVERDIDFAPRRAAVHARLLCRTDRLSFSQTLAGTETTVDG